MTQQIEWADGSGDKIYITAPDFSGNQQIAVSSDPNTGAARSKAVTFSAGNISKTLTVQQAAGLPYTPIEYIETDGIAYIDTGILGNAPKSCIGKMFPVTGSSYFFGCRKDSGNTRFNFFQISSSNNCGFAYANASYATAIDVSASINQTPIEFQTILQRGRCSLRIKQYGDSSFTEFSATLNTQVTTNRNMYLLAWNNQGTAAVCKAGTRCYPLTVYDSNNFTSPILDVQPCIYNGEYGLWDKISNRFLGNAANSGAFTGA